MVTVKVLYWCDASARFILEDRTCSTNMQSVKPFDYGLEAGDRIILVAHGYTAIATYVQGKETFNGLTG